MDTTHTPDPTAQDPAGLDLEALLDARRTLTRPVQFRRADDLVARHRELTAQLERARTNPDADRAMGEPTAAQAEHLLDQLAQEWNERGTPVTVQERTRSELLSATKELRHQRQRDQATARRKGEADSPTAAEEHAEAMLLTQLAACVLAPAFSVDQLLTLYRSSIAGQTAVERMWAMVQEVCEIPEVPTWPQSSDSPAGLRSEQS